MRTFLRALKALGLVVLGAAVVLSIYVAMTWNRTYDAPMPAIHASSDPAVIKRGENLVFGVAHCVECHTDSSETFERYAGRRAAVIEGRMALPRRRWVVFEKHARSGNRSALHGRAGGAHAALRRGTGRPGVDPPLVTVADASVRTSPAIVSFCGRSRQKNTVPPNEWTSSARSSEPHADLRAHGSARGASRRMRPTGARRIPGAAWRTERRTASLTTL